MSIMAIKHILTTHRKPALTAIFNAYYLRFVNKCQPIINARGADQVIDLIPFFTLAHDDFDLSCIMRLPHQGREHPLCFRPCFRGQYG